MKKNEASLSLMKFVDESPSMYHAIANLAKMLKEAGFVELSGHDAFKLKVGGKYFTTINGSAIIAWKMGKKIENGFRIIGSHSDSPTFKIKPSPDITVQNHYVKLNTECYGGAIVSTWFDRPLSVAGRLTIKGKDVLNPEVHLVNIDKNFLIIPNIAIHMNREVNEGYSYNKQKDTLPLMAIVEGKIPDKKSSFMSILAKEMGLKVEDILSFDLYLYDRTPGAFVGANKEFFSLPKIDNLGMAHPSIRTLISSGDEDFSQVACVFDNEEIGSLTRAGAGSPFLSDTLKRIVIAGMKAQNINEPFFEVFQRVLHSSFMISADQAHALHPNYTEKNDITNFPLMNKGPVIKNSASMSYMSDAVSASIFKEVCRRADVPFQTFVNRSDMRGGSTIGPITMGNLNIRCVDIGNPILSMHSIRELGGTLDQEYIEKAFASFYRA